MYRVLDGKAPKYLSDSFVMTRDIHTHNTRSSHSSLVIPHYGSHGNNSFYISGAKLWNSLPVSIIKSSQNLNVFKSKVKCIMYDRLFSTENSDFIYY